MVEGRIAVTRELAEQLEAHFCEDYQEHWMLYEDEDRGTHELRGYFADIAEGSTFHEALKEDFPELGPWDEVLTLQDADWKEAYKHHFRPWSDRGLHWVPVWERDSYDLPEGDCLIPLDPGMAFGTGNHETTRLCVRRLLDVRDLRQAELKNGLSVIDAGCGSGILALSAKKLGFSPVEGFDIDPDSVRISLDNARLCELEGDVAFRWADLLEGLKGKEADVIMANILANVLQEHADLLLAAVRPGGWLILSGILTVEVEAVAEHFIGRARVAWGASVSTESRTDGAWSDVLLVRP